MSDDLPTELVIELAQRFRQFVRQVAPSYQRAFFRFRELPGQYGSNASYVANGSAHLIGTIGQAAFFGSANEVGRRLFERLGKSEGVLILILDDQSNYKIHFDWNDPDRWVITKLNGGTGIPAGLPE